jgi:hypothetical protein
MIVAEVEITKWTCCARLQTPGPFLISTAEPKV